MQITQLLSKEAILLNASFQDKKSTITALIRLMEKNGNIADATLYEADVLKREALANTALSDGIATPHAKSKGVIKPGLAAMVVPEGVDFGASDNKPSRLLFLIATPDSTTDEHLVIISSLARLLMDETFRQKLLAATSSEEFLKIISEAENNLTVENITPEKNSNYDILAVTACPTGIAHTYMAAESLEKHAQNRHISIKVETNGSDGTKNRLTDAEIAAAKCIIIAADKNVPMERFDKKPVLIVKVADGINNADSLLDKAIKGDAPLYYATKEKDASSNNVGKASDSVGHQIYKHLMNGVSNMLPFVVGGGILIALAFLVDTFNPANPKQFGSGTPLAAFLMHTGGVSFGFMLPILSGFIAFSIADRPGLVTGFVGGALANAGGSGFLGALLSGFIAGYLVLSLKKLFSFLPHSLDGIKIILLYPLFGVFLIGVIIHFIVNPPVSGLNTWLIDTLRHMDMGSRILLGAILGGMMSVDMGGPVNKAAYVIATGMLAEGQYSIMASVMAGGMVPPLAIALCGTFFKNRFNDTDRKAAFTNYIMGLSFITEGAIPFAAADPLRVIPSCIIGSATAGALSMAFNCTLRAPHGGIFVVPIVGHPLMYMAAIATGSVVGMILLAILKKPLKN